jgi:amidase
VIRVTRDHSVFSLSADASPVAHVRPGDSFVLETMDCFSDQVQSADAALGGVDWEQINPATGPVYVEGVEAGDVLSVRIDRIQVADRGVMAVSGDFGVLSDQFDGIAFEMVDLSDGFAEIAGVRVPVRPMIGVIGVAPAGPPVACGSPGPHGGNMDTRIIGEGATVHFPVFVPGALLAAGDLHAAMGDGEICGTGVEIRGTIDLTVKVRRDLSLHEPVVETADVVAAIASAETLDEAAEQATRHMAELLQTRLGLSPTSAATLMSAAGQLQVSQVVDPLKTARFSMAKELLAPLGGALI